MTDIDQQLSDIRTADRAELVRNWVAAYGNPPPKGLSRRILEYSAAYHLQVKAFGGLSRRLTRQLAKKDQNRKDGKDPSMAIRSAKTLPPGSRLVREWHGITHTVDVDESGFVHDGTQYGSLSEIARAITGARWSGPRFFGL